MSDLIRCPKCEVIYVPGEAEFCPSCGTKLPNPLNVQIELDEIEDAPRPYAALRFVSALLVVGGWMIIIGGWIIALLWFTYANDGYYPDANNPTSWKNYVPLLSGFTSTIVGLIIIGAGQVYAVVLDIRDDMHTTMRYIRYGLSKSVEQ